MIFMESILLSLAGFVLGTAGAAALTYFLSKLPLTSMISSSTSPAVILLAFGIAILVGIIGAAYPGYRGAMLMPTEAIRHE
jgi:putative ABC transport system permease protein